MSASALLIPGCGCYGSGSSGSADCTFFCYNNCLYPCRFDLDLGGYPDRNFSPANWIPYIDHASPCNCRMYGEVPGALPEDPPFEDDPDATRRLLSMILESSLLFSSEETQVFYMKNYQDYGPHTRIKVAIHSTPLDRDIITMHHVEALVPSWLDRYYGTQWCAWMSRARNFDITVSSSSCYPTEEGWSDWICDESPTFDWVQRFCGRWYVQMIAPPDPSDTGFSAFNTREFWCNGDFGDGYDPSSWREHRWGMKINIQLNPEPTTLQECTDDTATSFSFPPSTFLFNYDPEASNPWSQIVWEQIDKMAERAHYTAGVSYGANPAPLCETDLVDEFCDTPGKLLDFNDTFTSCYGDEGYQTPPHPDGGANGFPWLRCTGDTLPGLGGRSCGMPYDWDRRCYPPLFYVEAS